MKVLCRLAGVLVSFWLCIAVHADDRPPMKQPRFESNRGDIRAYFSRLQVDPIGTIYEDIVKAAFSGMNQACQSLNLPTPAAPEEPFTGLEDHYLTDKVYVVHSQSRLADIDGNCRIKWQFDETVRITSYNGTHCSYNSDRPASADPGCSIETLMEPPKRQVARAQDMGTGEWKTIAGLRCEVRKPLPGAMAALIADQRACMYTPGDMDLSNRPEPMGRMLMLSKTLPIAPGQPLLSQASAIRAEKNVHVSWSALMPAVEQVER